MNPPVLPVVFGSLLFGLSTAFAAMWLTTKTTPWAPMCRKFPVRQEFRGDWLGFQTLRFGAYFHFKGCIMMGFAPDALYLKIWGFSFDKGAQIPWSEVTAITEEKTAFRSYVQFVLREGEPLTFIYTPGLRKRLAGNSLLR